MKNVILNKVIENRGGHYVHALELDSSYSFKVVIEELTSEFINDGFSIEEVKEFFNSMAIIYWTDEIENEIDESDLYNFDIDSFIDELI